MMNKGNSGSRGLQWYLTRWPLLEIEIAHLGSHVLDAIGFQRNRVTNDWKKNKGSSVIDERGQDRVNADIRSVSQLKWMPEPG